MAARPAVVFGGPSPEHDISVLTGLQAARLLAEAGADPLVLYWSKTGNWYRVAADGEAGDYAAGIPPKARELRFEARPQAGWFLKRRRLEVDTVLVCCHGGPGEDGTLQGALDLAGIRYSGPDAAASNLLMDKLTFGALMAASGFPCLPRVPVGAGGPPEFPPPYIVKPRFGGSSIGIEVVSDYDTAVALLRSSPHLDRGAVIEPYLEGGRDLNVAVRTYPQLELSAIEAPVSEQFYDYREKYLSGGGIEGSARELPARLPSEVEERLRSMARRVTELTGIRSMARIDFLGRDGELWINEVNTIPGSLSLYLWVDPPISRQQLVLDLVAELEASVPRRFSAAGADGTALRGAAAISKKLA
ncbi:D-alanine--D-alanine ligase family protein [Candidatus Spongiisocius sp.]|uniref:D-alanine--D-alanine ligase family protein n=1 Tax=Candidatus Spongiisocius sp. TaxID=3101273 RepID=UPI003B5C848F